MNAQARHDLLKHLSDRFQRLQIELAEIGEQVPFFDDREALPESSLAWEIENSYVIAEHQLGRRLSDDMFYDNTDQDGRPLGSRSLACAVPLDEAAAKYSNPAKASLDMYQRRDALQRIARELRDSVAQLELIRPNLVLDCDLWALENIVKHLRTKARQCDLIADHQIGLALDDYVD